MCVCQLNDTEVVRRRPPVRLESLKAKKEQMLTSREEIEEKIRLAEERRKVLCVHVGVFECDCVPQNLCSSSLSPSHGLSFFSLLNTSFFTTFTFFQLREDELKMRLRAKSARVHAPVSRTEEDEDTSLNPVEQLESALSSDLLQSASWAADVQDRMREAGGIQCEKNMGEADETEGTETVGGEGAERINDDSDKKEEEGLNKVEELLTAHGGLESDYSFQHTEDETF